MIVNNKIDDHILNKSLTISNAEEYTDKQLERMFKSGCNIIFEL